MKEACAWLSYTYLFVRMLRNPLAYGVPWEELAADPRLEGRRRQLITDAARKLEGCARSVLPPRGGVCREGQRRPRAATKACNDGGSVARS